MSPGRIASERVYRLVSQMIVDGPYAPGDMLSLQRIAYEIGTSVSPVRDAVHRLVGERSLTAGSGGGFTVPILSAVEMKDLYSWHARITALALRKPLTAGAVATLQDIIGPDMSSQALARSAAAIFDVMAASSGNFEIIRAVSNASARLHAARVREPELIKGVRLELESIVALARTGSPGAVRSAVAEYHRRRVRRSRKIASIIHPE